MATERQLRVLENRCYKYSTELLGALSDLSKAVTEILGYEVVADLCGGEEIEFRPISNEGYVDDYEKYENEFYNDKICFKDSNNLINILKDGKV